MYELHNHTKTRSVSEQTTIVFLTDRAKMHGVAKFSGIKRILVDLAQMKK